MLARPLKQGLDYFPLDVDIDQDDKFQLVEALHGVKGFGIAIKLLMRIYKEGFYYQWTETEQILFSRRVNENINDVVAVVNDCIKYSIFDQEMYEGYEILTSHGIQLRYFEAVKRRKKVEVEGQFFLLNVNDYNNVHLLEVNVNINSQDDVINADIGTQSKVKERREEKSKAKQTTQEPSSPVVIDNSFGEIATFYEQNVGPLIPHIGQTLGEFVDEYSSALTLYALKKSVEAKARSIPSYMLTILRSWKSSNLKTIEQIESHENNRVPYSNNQGQNQRSVFDASPETLERQRRDAEKYKDVVIDTSDLPY